MGFITLVIRTFELMVTIRDIARIAKVSTGTVDRVLHNRGGVSKKTADKINKILKEQNFEVNQIASTLARQKKYTICTLIPQYDEQNLFWKSPSMGIEKAAREVKNYGVSIANFLYDQNEPLDYLKQFDKLLRSNPDAVILVPTFINETKQVVSRLEQKGIPYAFLNIDVEGFNNITFIGQDSYKSGYLAGKLMYPGFDNCTCLTVQTKLSNHNYYVTAKRLEGFNDYFKKNNNPIQTLNIKVENFNDLRVVKKEINDLLAKNKAIKGVFVPSSRVAKIAHCIEPNRLKTLKIIGYDTTPQNIACLENGQVEFLISQKSFDQGSRIVQLLTSYLLHKTEPMPKILAPIDIITKENLEFNVRNSSYGWDND